MPPVSRAPNKFGSRRVISLLSGRAEDALIRLIEVNAVWAPLLHFAYTTFRDENDDDTS